MLNKRTVTLNGTKFTLGKKYRDTLLDVSGIATAGCAYYTGCDQLELKFKDSDGSVNSHWVDVTCVEAVPRPKKGALVIKRPGGPPPQFNSGVPIRGPGGRRR